MLDLSNCCRECFAHPWPRNECEACSTHNGTCPYCGSNSGLCPIEALAKGFLNLFSDYQNLEVGLGSGDRLFPPALLEDAVQRDWSIFSELFSKSPAKRNFFANIYEKAPKDTWPVDLEIPVVPFHRNAMSTAFDRWREFLLVDKSALENLKSLYSHEDINTPGTFLNQQAQQLRTFIRVVPKGKVLWRARGSYIGSSQFDCNPLTSDLMGANPAAPASRLNANGELVLYCAESEQTSVAEIRPGRGYFVTTCILLSTSSLQVLDLADGFAEINPFTCEHLSWNLDLRRVFRNLAGLVAQPTTRGEDEYTYLPTQAIARIVRAMQLDGIRFPSSLDFPKGRNLAVFDPSKISFGETKLVKIDKTSIEFTEVPRRVA